MRKSTKIVLGIIGTVVLGALGSGFWDLCLRDLFTWIGHGILSATTLGITSVRDSFYIEIAKGRTDRVGIYLLTFAFIFFGALMGFFMRGGKFAQKLHSQITPADFRFLRLTAGFCFVLLYSVLSFRMISISYTTSAIDHFEQAYAICLPFMSSLERDEVRSSFALIKTKGNYVSVLSKLEAIAHDHKAEIPKFSVW